MKVYLFRHGETVGNVKGEFAGVTDTPLTANGIQQAKQAANKLKGKKFEIVLASPLSRAVETAKLVQNQPIELLEELKEMNFGYFEGLTYAEIQEQYPQAVKKWQKEGLYFEFPSGESVRSFFDRIITIYHNILTTYEGKDILIVAHSGVIRCILAHEISESFEHYWRYKIDNCGLSVIAYEDGYTILEGSNL